MQEESFEDLPIKTYKIKNNSEILYRIFKNEKDFVDFEVSSLQEALSTSKIENPTKIEVIIFHSKKCLSKEELEEWKEEVNLKKQ